MNLAMIYSALHDIGVPITQVFPATENTKGGILVDKVWLIQITKNQEEPILLDKICFTGMINAVSSFHSVNDLLQFIMEYDEY